MKQNAFSINALTLNQTAGTIAGTFVNVNVSTTLQSYPSTTPLTNATLAGNFTGSGTFSVGSALTAVVCANPSQNP